MMKNLGKKKHWWRSSKLLIVRSPLRISLAGGGTDLPCYYNEHGGVVINTAIDRYFYVFLRTEANNSLSISSADFNTFFHHNGNYPFDVEGVLELPRSIFQHFGITHGLRMFIASEIPPGTGLGSSSSVSVGLIKALSVACGIKWSREDIAELASYIEIEKLGSPIGKQDQYAASLGGMNLIEFEKDNTRVTKLNISLSNRRLIENSLMLFYTGQSRSANGILSKQTAATKGGNGKTLSALHAVKKMVPMVKKCLETGDMRGFGELIHENWIEKKKFAKGVSNDHIEKCYSTALASGAYGGKITGAGGGGFLLLCCDQQREHELESAMEVLGLTRVSFHIDDLGAQVIMNSGLRLTSMINWKQPAHLLQRIKEAV